ncbi:pyroglutamyl-peptidase [Clostridium tetanomorphum]|uniref:Pyrrolidone-carboxylate peptidase n=1 Tax=Clostridium tetanomorphum TaxID=1553 RepID=A0A923E6Z2_CLOTT|nr:pyroglutamyl-peptidase I [Clostridium tetanomorphum]KAJ51308.1 pyrrolidone-carboxylate peptidase [Clostridium tetanomorphum DSM 665]MBC2397558.1 pyroglutamyl-peptidase I [Clostridium tetanomorphum]MBP1863655.1 pyroglutamyl-peptidase [Clostridium tetanomorphum]NRS86231.1 pyroglutamyl-peptidase [Clostridium tetanomorphum]NRZ95690.1 pyroglutamyl-peptidase [Clostridium tetanomorphum]
MRVLITGFDPFGGEKVNPSFEAVKKVDDKISGAEIIKVQIPTVFRKSIEEVEKLITIHKPDIVICVGQAGGRFDITVERVAINVDDARIADNEGNQPVDTKIFEDGESAYFSNLPVKAMVSELKNNNIPASLSNTAGTFVCNHIMYGLLYLINKKHPNIKGGFIHVPYIAEQVITKPNTPFMDLDKVAKGLTFAIKAAVENKEDLNITLGRIC